MKTPPHDAAAERAVLGAILLAMDRQTLQQVGGVLAAEDFYKEAHRIIYRAMIEVEQAGGEVDMVQLTSHLQTSNQLDAVGGVDYLGELVRSVATAVHVLHYAQIVLRHHQRRQVIDVAYQLAVSAREGDLDGAIDTATRELAAIANADASTHPALVQHCARDALAIMLESLDREDSDQPGVIDTGLVELNKAVGGFRPGQLVVLGARTGAGKSALALNIALNAARSARASRVLFLSLEMSRTEQAERAMAITAKIDVGQVDSGGGVTPNYWTRLVGGVRKLKGSPLYLDDTARLTPQQLRAKIAWMISEAGGVDLVVVDYLQLMESGLDGKTVHSRRLEVAHISHELKAIAKEHKCVVLALSQFNREQNKAASRTPPTKYNLYECGAIEHDADVIMLIWHRDRRCWLVIDKQRRGEAGIAIPLAWRPNWTRFDTPEREPERVYVSSLLDDDPPRGH